MTRDAATLDLFRSTGAALRRGIPLPAPKLPRSRTTRALLEREARRDPSVRKAYQAAAAQVAETEQARQLQPGVFRRDCGEILKVR